MISGLGPVVFRALIGGFRNLLLVVHWSFDYMGNPPRHAGLILVPVFGAGRVSFLVEPFLRPRLRSRASPK